MFTRSRFNYKSDKNGICVFTHRNIMKMISVHHLNVKTNELFVYMKTKYIHFHILVCIVGFRIHKLWMVSDEVLAINT